METLSEHKPLKSSATFKAYAKVWWETNLILVLSLGVMLPWSIWKRRKFFYQNVRLDDTPFTFTARAKNMFLGVWVGIGLWVLVNFLFEYIGLPQGSWFEIIVSTLVFYILTCPFFAYFTDQALTFRRYYSNYCGINFRFDRNYREALICMFGFFVLSPLTLFIVYPYFKWRFFKYRFSRTEFGGLSMQYDSALKDFFRAYIKFFCLSILPSIVILSPIILAYLIWGDYLVEFYVLVLETYYTSFYFEIIDSFFWPMLMLVSLTFFIGLSYLDVAVTNINWNAISLDRVIFGSQASFGKLIWIRTSNLVLILCSFGFLIPLAKVRNLHFWTESKYYWGDLNRLKLKAEAQEGINALGEGVSDIAGLDIGI